MKEQEKLEAISKWVIQYKKLSFLGGITGTFVDLITGSFLAWLKSKYADYKFGKMLSIKDKGIFKLPKQRDRCNKYYDEYIYGDKLTLPQKIKIKTLNKDGININEIRLLVKNKILNKDGVVLINKLKEFVLFMAGILFLLIVFYVFILFSASVWLSPIMIPFKIVMQLLIIVVCLYSGYVMSYFSIFTKNVYKKLIISPV